MERAGEVDMIRLLRVKSLLQKNPSKQIHNNEIAAKHPPNFDFATVLKEDENTGNECRQMFRGKSACLLQCPNVALLAENTILETR